jgi:hypothetical protein
MATVQHYIRSHGESSLAALASLYGVSASAISNATFGGSGASLIYPWLRDNGGTRQSAAPQVPTGYHWSFAPGMVVNIPGVEESLSPSSYYADPPAIPGGPEVTVFYVDSPVVGDAGAPSTGRESWNEDGEEVPDTDIGLVDPNTGQEVGYAGVGAGAGFLGLSLTTWLMIGVGYWYLSGGKKKKKGRRRTTRRKRRTTRKRRRRYNYHRQFYGDDDD